MFLHFPYTFLYVPRFFLSFSTVGFLIHGRHARILARIFCIKSEDRGGVGGGGESGEGGEREI